MSVSVDGFVGGPKGEADWIFRSMDDSAAAWTLNSIWQAGVHIMGSRTFHDMISYWPYSNEPFAAPINEIPKIVFSKKGFIEPTTTELTTTALRDAIHAGTAGGLKKTAAKLPQNSNWADAEVASGDLTEEINRLKQQPGKDIMAHGGASFAQSLVKLGLIDEYQLLTHPVARGKGLPLFSALPGPLNLRLISTTPFNAGAVAHVYRPAK